MTENKDTELKEKILREILCNYMDDDTVDTEIACNSHFTSAIKIAIDDGFEAGRREVLDKIKYELCVYGDGDGCICSNCSKIDEFEQDLTSDPQTSNNIQLDVIKSNQTPQSKEAITKNNIYSEESSSEGCGEIIETTDWINGCYKDVKCGDEDYLCDECKLKTTNESQISNQTPQTKTLKRSEEQVGFVSPNTSELHEVGLDSRFLTDKTEESSSEGCGEKVIKGAYTFKCGDISKSKKVQLCYKCKQKKEKTWDDCTYTYDDVKKQGTEE